MLIPDEVRKCTVFLAYQNPDGLYVKLGTAFLVDVPSAIEYGTFGHFVTAKHIIAKIREKGYAHVFMRINTHEGSEWVRSDIDDWISHPDDPYLDVAVLPLGLPTHLFDYKTIPVSMAATENVIAANGIGPGEEVFLTGLFSKHTGRKRNLPIIRTGTIALMPEEPIETKILGNYYEIDAYLIEARSIGGLSGSPVFVYTGMFRPGTIIAGGPMFFWLGLMHGHWDTEPLPDLIEEDSSSGMGFVNMGIAIVIPVTKILEVINQPLLLNRRRVFEENHIGNNLTASDTADEGASVDG